MQTMRKSIVCNIQPLYRHFGHAVTTSLKNSTNTVRTSRNPESKYKAKVAGEIGVCQTRVQARPMNPSLGFGCSTLIVR